MSSTPIPTGDVNVRMLFEATEHKPGTGGHVSLFINDEKVGEGDMPRTVPVTFTSYSGMDIGRDNGLVVDRAYEDKAPYAFTGTVKQVVFDIKPATHEEEQALHEHGGAACRGRGCRRLTISRWSAGRATRVTGSPGHPAGRRRGHERGGRVGTGRRQCRRRRFRIRPRWPGLRTGPS